MQIGKLPFPSSGLGGVDFHKLAGRSCALVCGDGENRPVRALRAKRRDAKQGLNGLLFFRLFNDAAQPLLRWRPLV